MPAAQKQPVISAIPTLLLVGEYDPIAPPANDHLAQQTLATSYLYQFPGTGHGVLYTNACPDSIAVQFETQPEMQPSCACIAQMGEPAFQVI